MAPRLPRASIGPPAANAKVCAGGCSRAKGNPWQINAAPRVTVRSESVNARIRLRHGNRGPPVARPLRPDQEPT
jgi:hypothetical protein